MLLLPLALAGDPVAPPVTMSVVPAAGRVSVGQALDVAVVLDVPEGWHIYWENPGQSGLATDVRLTTRATVTGPALPAPTRFVTDGLTSYGYHGPTGFVFSVATDASGPVVLDAVATYLLCRDICVRGEASATANVRVVKQAPTPPLSPFRSRVPTPFPGTFTLGSALNLRLPGPGPFDVFPSVPLEAVWTPLWREDAGGLVLEASFSAPIPAGAHLVVTRGAEAFTLTLTEP